MAVLVYQMVYIHYAVLHVPHLQPQRGFVRRLKPKKQLKNTNKLSIIHSDLG